jgi:F-type H+-transporting ATPase subunit a
MILAIEVLSLFIKHTILAVRLLANMFAGHLVLGVILAFIPLFVHQLFWYGVAPAAILGAACLNLLELLVAFIQAYVFAFLAALFIGMAVHQH